MGGDKRVSSEIYDCTGSRPQGFIGVNIEYRLAPEIAVRRAALRTWAWRWPGPAANVAWHGGDPGSIFAIGHSAGGTHVGTHAYDPVAGYLGRDFEAWCCFPLGPLEHEACGFLGHR